MKGLLIKDFKLLKMQKNSLVTVVTMSIGMSIFFKDASFIIGYMSFIGSLLTLGTISYDEFDNGNAFLFSLPITRKTYTLEKYEFGLIVSGVLWLFATVIAIIAGLLKSTIIVEDTIITALLILPVMLISLAVMLPFQIKFGGEKGRIALIATVGLMFAIAFAAVRIAALFNIDLNAMFSNLPALSAGKLIVIILGIALIVLLISLKISVSIMNRKEF